MDDLSSWVLVALGIIALIQGWATFGPWVRRMVDPAKFDLTFGDGGTTVSRSLRQVGAVTLRVRSLSKRPIKADQFFVLFAEQLTLQAYSYAGVQMQPPAAPPVVTLREGGRFRGVGAPWPVYFSRDDSVLFDLVFSAQSTGDFQLRVRIWPAGEPVVESSPMTINFSP